MSRTIRLIVTDAAPLITLAAADSLDFLLFPKLPVILPDAVLFEATNAGHRLGAAEIIAWLRAAGAAVRVEPTEVFTTALAMQRADVSNRLRDVGERAMLEIVRDPRILPEDGSAILLSDDRGMQRLTTADPDRVVLLATVDYLEILERAHRIQSADAVLEAALARGRSASRRSFWSEHDPAIADQIAAILRVPRDA